VHEQDAEVEKGRGEKAQLGSGPSHVVLRPPATNQTTPRAPPASLPPSIPEPAVDKTRMMSAFRSLFDSARDSAPPRAPCKIITESDDGRSFIASLPQANSGLPFRRCRSFILIPLHAHSFPAFETELAIPSRWNSFSFRSIPSLLDGGIPIA